MTDRTGPTSPPSSGDRPSRSGEAGGAAESPARPALRSVLVTGACGFIGANFVRLVRRTRPDTRLVLVDKLTYAGNLENVEPFLADPMVQFVQGDIADRKLISGVLAQGIDALINIAAETHVDRSILDAAAFLQTNVIGVQVLLEEVRAAGCKQMVQVSTDEVYGSLPAPQSATRQSLLQPTSPYSASKASADLLALAWHHTHGVPVVVTRATNNYGPYQFPEKMLPLMITNAMDDRHLPVYGDGQQVRDWIHVEDHCEGLLAALERGVPGKVYHFGGGSERTNLEMVKFLLDRLGKPADLIRHVSDRPGHDRRYSLDTSETRRELDWSPRVSLADGLAATIDWYQQHRPWWDKIKSGEYRSYYEKMYGRRAGL